MVKLTITGNWNKTEEFLKRNQTINTLRNVLDKYGREGIAALSSATPVDTGKTASSWTYDIVQNEKGISIVFKNLNETKDGIPIAILLQYGHGNGRGGYVQGRDFINPAIQPIFDKITEDAWKEVNK